MIKKNKNTFIFLSMGLVLVVSMFFSFNKKDEYKELPKVKVKDTFKNKQFALMLEQDNGEYKESTGELPTEGYVFNKEKSGCTDVNGKIIPNAIGYDYETYTVLVDTSKTSYCYLYYDKEPNIGYLRSKDNNSQLTKELTGGMYRYQGTNDVANWICFGTKDIEQCKENIDKYMYRIIGINAKGELYLLKETFLKEDDVTVFAWNNDYLISDTATYLCPNGVCPEWNDADLFKRINGIFNGTSDGSGSTSGESDTDIFVDSEYYEYLKSGDEVNGGEEESDWYSLIQTHSWYYGDTIERNNVYNGNEIYAIETGDDGDGKTVHYVKGEDGKVTSETYTWTNKVDAKISLMYIHDYTYAYPGGNPNNATNVKNSWIFFQKDGYNNSSSWEWLSTRWGIYNASSTNVFARSVNSNSDLNGGSNLVIGIGVRPVFYLSNKINLSGNGTKESPYTLSWN